MTVPPSSFLADAPGDVCVPALLRRRGAKRAALRPGRLLPRFSLSMATVFIKKMVVSVARPLLRLSSCTGGPRALSTLLLGPLRAALPVEAKPSPAVASLLSSRLAPCLPPALGFKTKGVIKKRCKDCYRVKRRGRWFIYCKTNPRHKQRQM